MKKYRWTIPIIIVFWGIILYVLNLGGFPPAVHCDEILPAIFGQQILKGGVRNVIGVSWFSIPNLVFLPHGLSTSILGNSVFSARLPSAIIAILSLISLFYLGKVLFNTKIALISTILLSASHWWIASSRSGLINIETVLPEILAFYFIFRGFREKRLIFFAISGFFTSLGLYLYLNSRIVPFIILTLFVYQIFTNPNKSDILKKLFVWAGVAIFFFWPMLRFYYLHPNTFLSRSYIAFIFSPDQGSLQHMESIYHTNNRLMWILGNIKGALNLSTNFIDTGKQYGYQGRALEVISLFLFLAGQIIAFFKFWKNPEYFFLLSWFWLTYIAFGILTHGISLQRLVGLLPAVYLLCAISMEKAWREISSKLGKKIWKNIFTCIISALIFTSVLKNLKIYFIDNPKNRLTIFVKDDGKKLSEFFQKLNNRYEILFLTPLTNISPTWCLFPLLTPNLKMTSVYKGQPIPLSKAPKLFIVWKNYEDDIQNIQLKYPGGNFIQNELEGFFIYQTR